jgi:hypothetical protein
VGFTWTAQCESSLVPVLEHNMGAQDGSQASTVALEMIVFWLMEPQRWEERTAKTSLPGMGTKSSTVNTRKDAVGGDGMPLSPYPQLLPLGMSGT